MRRIRFVDWLARRERPRDPEKARLLRERGTPEHPIGPETSDLDEDEALRLAVEAQHKTRPG